MRASRAENLEFADEARLVALAVGRDEAAIRTIVSRYNQRLYRIARGVFRDDSEAEDIVQQAYVHAFTHLDGFRGESRLGTWLSRIVLNEAFARLRRRRSAAALEGAVEAAGDAQVIQFPNANPSTDPERTLAQRQIQVMLEHAIDELPEPFRLVLVARVVEEMSIEETAELLALRPETVKTRLHRARAMVKKTLEQQLGPALTSAYPFMGRRCERLADALVARLAATG